MTKLKFDWVRRYTTAEDLLDDGVENFSDVKAWQPGADEEQAPSLESIERRRQTLERVRAEHEQHLRELYRRAFSFLGIFLGVMIALAGCALVAFPVDMLVEHARFKYLPTVVEHVTPARSRLYGSALAVAGLALIGYALYRPRRQ